MRYITIDGREYPAEEGKTVLDVARANGIKIPTLCYHPALTPSGSCKLCGVEVTGSSGRPVIMLSCILKAKEGLAVNTTGEKVELARRKAFRSLLQMSPQSRTIRMMADEYGVDLGPPPDGCIRCRLCVRVCREIVGASALKMEKREGTRYIVPVEGECIGCGTCVNICPTNVIGMEDRDNVRIITIRDETIGRHPLETCEGCGKRFATPKFLEHIQKRTRPHAGVKEPHQYCPTCAKLLSDRIRTAGAKGQQNP